MKKQRGLELISLPHFLHDFWAKIFVALYSINWPNLIDFMPFLREIIYKKTDEWYIEWRRVTTNDIEWYNKLQRMTMSDNEWYNERQGVVQWMTKNDNEWQRVTKNGNEWQRVRAVVQRMKTAQYTSKNGWLPSFQWQKEIHYYFTGWMAAVRVVK